MARKMMLKDGVEEAAYDFDLFVIGAGSGGVRSARTAAGFGAKVAICELPFHPISSETIGGVGGTCVIRGCVPKKILVYGASFSSEFEDSRNFGWDINGPITFDWKRLRENKTKEITRLNGVYKRLLTNSGVTMLEGEAKLVEQHAIEVIHPDGAHKHYTAQHILIATGSRASQLNIPGKDLAITSDEALSLEELPKRVVILGGGYIAVEFAGIWNGMGSKVDLLYRKELPLRGFDDEMRAVIAKNLENRGVNLHPNTSLSKLENTKEGIKVFTDHGEELTADVVLFAIGYTMFIKSIDASAHVKNATYLCEAIEEVIAEVGEENVIQVVTDNAANYVAAGKLLMERHPTIFWSPCAAHCIDLMLEEIGKLEFVKSCVERAKNICKFIYNHAFVLSTMRKYTGGKELARPGITRFASNFITLQSLLTSRDGLRSMFVGQDWICSSYSTTTVGLDVADCIFDEDGFWKPAREILKVTEPLVALLRTADGEKPSMGYIYEGMDRAKEAIRAQYAGVQERYGPIWDIIDRRWQNQLHRPIHAAAYYLNPAFRFRPEFKADAEVLTGLYTVIQRLSSDENSAAAIVELDQFNNKEGPLFSGRMAINAQTRLQPGRVPNTKRLNLGAVGVETDKIGAVKVNEFSQSTVPTIWAVGDVTNRINLTPVALMEGTCFAKTVFGGQPTKPDYKHVPCAVFCMPPLSVVGLTEQQAIEQAKNDIAIFTSAFTPMKNTISARQEKTIMKLIVDCETDKVLGASMCGPDAPEIMQGIAVALKSGATKAHFDSTVGIHPSAAEEFVTMRTATRRISAGTPVKKDYQLS